MAEIDHVFHVQTDDLEFTFGGAAESPTKSANRSPRACTPRSVKSDGSFEFTFGPGGLSFAKTDTPRGPVFEDKPDIPPPSVDPTSPHSTDSLSDEVAEAGNLQLQIPGVCTRIQEQPQHYVAPAQIPAAPAQMLQYTQDMLIAQQYAAEQEQQHYIAALEQQQHYATVIEQQQLAAQAQAAAAAQVVEAGHKYAIAQAEAYEQVRHEQTVKATSSCCSIL